MSLNRATKLLMPVNSTGWTPSQLQNESPIAKIMGTSVKMQKPMKFGAMKL